MIALTVEGWGAIGGMLVVWIEVIVIVLLISAIIRLFINISKTAKNTEQMKEELIKHNTANNQNEVTIQQDTASKIEQENYAKKQAAETEKLKQHLQKAQKDRDILIFLVTTISRKLAESPFADKCQGLLRHIDTVLEQIEKR